MPFSSQRAVRCVTASTIVVAGVYWYWCARGTYFIYDELEFWNQQRNSFNPSRLLEPYMGSLNAVLFLIWTILDQNLSLNHYEIYRLLPILAFCVFLWSFTILCKRLALDSIDTFMCLGILAIAGPVVGNMWGGWQLAWIISLAAGTLSLALQLTDKPSVSKLLVTMLLSVAILSSSVGLTFLVINLFVAVAFKRARLVVGITFVGVLYGLWQLVYGADGLLASGPQLLAYFTSHLSASVMALFGMYSEPSIPRAGIALFVTALIVLEIKHLGCLVQNDHERRLRAVHTSVLAGLLVWTALLSISRTGLAVSGITGDSFTPTSVRYVHIGFTLVLTCIATLKVARLRKVLLGTSLVLSFAFGFSFHNSQMVEVRRLGNESRAALAEAVCNPLDVNVSDYDGFGRLRYTIIRQLVNDGRLVCPDK